MLGWTGEHVRHAAEMVRQGRNPAARVYESIGSDFFLAPSPGWLNLGLWDGAGSEDQAEAACRRLVATLASALPAGGMRTRPDPPNRPRPTAPGSASPVTARGRSPIRCSRRRARQDSGPA